MNGRTGRVLYSDPRAHSFTAFDYPVAADVDADGHLEVVTGSVDGLYVFGDDVDWASGRRVWNQSDYRMSNINEDKKRPERSAEASCDFSMVTKL